MKIATFWLHVFLLPDKNENEWGDAGTESESGNPGHFLTRLPGSKKRACVYCSMRNTKHKLGWPVKSHYKCSQCDIALCRTGQGCFESYHKLKSCHPDLSHEDLKRKYKYGEFTFWRVILIQWSLARQELWLVIDQRGHMFIFFYHCFFFKMQRQAFVMTFKLKFVLINTHYLSFVFDIPLAQRTVSFNRTLSQSVRA